MENSIKYKFNIFPLSEEDGGGFYAEVPELSGCIASADTIEETIALLQEAIESWVQVSEEKGKNIPRPKKYTFEDELPSGRFSVRISKSSHKSLLEIAEKEGESLNGIVTKFLDQMIVVGTVENILKDKADECFKREKQELELEGNLFSSSGVWRSQRDNKKNVSYEAIRNTSGGYKGA